MASVTGKVELDKAVHHCLKAILRSGFGEFTVRAVMKDDQRIRVHVDGGIYSVTVIIRAQEIEEFKD